MQQLGQHKQMRAIHEYTLMITTGMPTSAITASQPQCPTALHVAACPAVAATNPTGAATVLLQTPAALSPSWHANALQLEPFNNC